MNILWIEDFGGLSNPGTNILIPMFGGLLSFENWDEDEMSLLKNPSDLEKFTRENSPHRIFLCRHYYDYVDFNSNHDIIKEIDAVIIDIRLNHKVDRSLNIPIKNQDSESKEKFHEHAGFYIFNNLAHLGFPVEKMCFMTGQGTSLDDFHKKCGEFYIPQPEAFEKGDSVWSKLRDWIAKQNSEYTILRRGVIDGCQVAKSLVENNQLYFTNYLNADDQINSNDIANYFDIIGSFLPLRQSNTKSDLYKLFVRTLSHEWEGARNIRPNRKKEDAMLAWIMRNTRHWITHNSSLFNEVEEKLVAYLFIINMRVMFSFSDDSLQAYESILLSLFANDVVPQEDFKNKYSNQLIPVSDAYVNLKNIVFDERVVDSFYFNELANNIQLSKSLLRNNKKLFARLLYQMFFLTLSYPRIGKDRRDWLKIHFHRFNYMEKRYINEIARHIYNASFAEA